MSWLLRQRSTQLERMDQETLDPATATAVLGALERINARLGGVAATLYHFERFAKYWVAGQVIRVVDWGTGGADIPRALVRWARSKGYSFQIVGVDSNPAVFEYARILCRDYPEIEIVQQDALAEGTGLGTQPFDYAISSLTLHHLNDEEIVELLRTSHKLAARGIIMNDLKRSRRAWLWIWLLSRITRAPEMVQHDGPLSVERAFRPAELEAFARKAGLSYLKVRTHFGHRLTLAGEKR
jgi:hypothetical protein